jgi:DNA-directed RNA polymerase subunit N (RpoN/RPB10)
VHPDKIPCVKCGKTAQKVWKTYENGKEKLTAYRCFSCNSVTEVLKEEGHDEMY